MNLPRILPLILALLLYSPLAAVGALVGHWKIDEGSGTVAADASGNDRTGTVAGSPAWSTTGLPPVPDGTTAALDMDGTDDQINIVGYKGVTGTGARTVSAWVRTRLTTPVQNKGIVSWGANVATQKWTFRIQSSNGTQGTIRAEVNGGFIVGNTVVTDGEWHHVAVTWEDDGTPNILDAKLYVDGVLDAEFGSLDTPPSASQSQTINTASNADVRIGDNFQATHNWDGWIDDVRIYDEALEATEIAALAQGTAIITSFSADAEIVASGAPVELSWVSDPTNDALVIDNGVGDVLGSTTVTVNPVADTTYTITGTRGGDMDELELTVLVDKAPVIDSFFASGPAEIIEGGSAVLRWEAFGEVTLDINGTDVSGDDQLVVSPTEDTVYTLSATNAFGTTTAEVTITVLAGNTPDLSWSAAGLPEGNLATWDPAINATANQGISFTNNTGGTVQSGASNFANISQWVNSPGYNMASNPLDSFQDGLGDITTKTNVSWEMVFRPGDFTGTHVLFNTGGNGDGTAIVLTGSTLDFRFQDANTAAQRLIISTDLAAIGEATDFYHLVATCDVDTATTGTAELYVNGVLAAGPATSTGVIDDWDGGDLAELGKGNNIPTSTAFAPDAFTGDIALFNFYGGRVLNESQITDAFNAISGEGGATERQITHIFYNADEDRIELTFNSLPNRDYAVWESPDLSTWFEINDAVPSQGTETTFFVEGLVLPDPALPRNFYEIREPEN